MAANPFSQVKTDIIPLLGGLDLVTTPILVKPGKVISSNNFEPDINGGYRRLPGIERLDGRPRPHASDYYIAEVIISGIIALGDVITGSTSGATAKVLLVVDSTHLVLTKLTGVFVSETFTISAVAQGSISSNRINAGLTNALHSYYKSLAANEYRADISSVPGSGRLRGIKYFNGNIYAWKDNVAATSCVMHVASSSGWTAITFGKEIQFAGAVGEIFEGDTVTQLVSGATGVVKRALLRTGTWTVSGIGTLVFDSVTGTFDATNALQVSAVTKVTASSLCTDITLLPGGKFDFSIYNFSGGVTTERLYCADGVNLAGEFDGVRWVPIRTGAAVDTPKFIKGHKNQLIVAQNADLFVSSIGDPYSWTAVTGAGDIPVGEVITNIKPQTGDATNGAMVVTTNRRTLILYGNDITDFNLVVHSPNNGGRAYTMQNIGFAHYLDARGITQLVASQSYGGFQSNVLTNNIQPLIDAKLGTEISSCVVKSSNQYRLFFSDGTGVICQVVPDAGGGTAIGASMPFDYGDIVFNVIDSVIDDDGKERIFGGATNGYVYELNVGTSLDGEVIPAHFLTVFNNSRSPRLRKRYRRSILQFKAGNTASLRIGYDLSYGNGDASYGRSVNSDVYGAGGYWDNFTWDNFTWDAAYIQQLTIDTVGSGENLSLAVTSESDQDESFVVHTCFIHYTLGRLNR